MLGAQKQKHKKQPFSDTSASHLSLVLRHVWFQAEAWISRTTPLTPPSPARAVASPKGLKPLAFGEKPNPVGTWYFTSAHNRNITLDISHLARTRSIASLPCKIVWEIDTTSFQEIILSLGFFRRETASGFYPWGKKMEMIQVVPVII